MRRIRDLKGLGTNFLRLKVLIDALFHLDKRFTFGHKLLLLLSTLGQVPRTQDLLSILRQDHLDSRHNSAGTLLVKGWVKSEEYS